MKNYLIIGLFVTILLLLIYIGSCTHSGKSVPEIQYKDSITEIHTVDSFPVEGKPVPYPEPYEVIKHDSIPYYAAVDTAKIISNYFAENKFKLNINDSLGNIDVFLTLQFNQVKEWNYKGKFKTYTVTIKDTKTIYEPKRNKLLAGLILHGNQNYFGASPSLMLVTKKDNAFQIGYDVINGNYSAGYLLKIGKR